METNKRGILPLMKSFLFLLVMAVACSSVAQTDGYIVYIADPAREDIRFFWKNDNNEKLRSIERLKSWVEKNNNELLFAMNAGMYTTENSPQGLYIENYNTLVPLDTSAGKGNFYMKPNGVFYMTASNKPAICNTTDFLNKRNIKYATQSGPLLIIKGNIHPSFNKDSKNINIRNGVGILPNGKIIFAMSKREVNFYEFASFFQQLGCTDALYLDGYVSRMYLPHKKWLQTDGDFGVMIGIIKK